MKYTFLTLLLVAIFMVSCEKDEVKTSPLTSLNVSNFVIAGQPLRLGSNRVIVNNNGYGQLTLIAGDNSLYIWPTTDSTKPYYTNSKFTSQNSEVYSLFMAGDTLAPEGILVKETIPYRQDSTAGIRFINLSPNSTPLSITLADSPTVNEVTDLGYKQMTEFKSYPGLAASTYQFEVRDFSTVAPAAPLTTFSLSAAQVPRFANITLVIRGLIGASPSVGITRINNDR